MFCFVLFFLRWWGEVVHFLRRSGSLFPWKKYSKNIQIYFCSRKINLFFLTLDTLYNPLLGSADCLVGQTQTFITGQKIICKRTTQSVRASLRQRSSVHFSQAGLRSMVLPMRQRHNLNGRVEEPDCVCLNMPGSRPWH